MKICEQVNSLNPNFKSFLSNRRQRVDGFLKKYLTTITRKAPKTFSDAIHYVVLNGGKRIRSLLVYAVGEMFSANPEILDIPAAAIELIHAFSLVHDDLPAMDNDSLRRGKPTCHIMFDEATAILVGDVLAIAAFHILTESKKLSADQKVEMIKLLAEASGPQGMAGGQYIDLHLLGKKLNSSKLEEMYLLKTGALIRVAVKLGALAANVKNKKTLEYLDQFAKNIGLAFQIQDDVLNIESTAKRLGKNIGTDRECGKTTYPILLGTKNAKKKIATLWHRAAVALHKVKYKKDRSGNFKLVGFTLLDELLQYVMQRDF